ncbi:hypothetical protein FRT60_13380 [Pseudomonas haemolytica]|uniref:Uncharacterized protein n=1 Tax=Pseudomonas haemolytica TaxID=2600065 RepID=A0A646NZI2_9PSED|nr:hypothetical protein [Pseudomonas haemolytica]
MWERACSRMRSVSHRGCRLIYRIREQARSHTLICCGLKSWPGSTGVRATPPWPAMPKRTGSTTMPAPGS